MFSQDLFFNLCLCILNVSVICVTLYFVQNFTNVKWTTFQYENKMSALSLMVLPCAFKMERKQQISHKRPTII